MGSTMARARSRSLLELLLLLHVGLGAWVPPQPGDWASRTVYFLLTDRFACSSAQPCRPCADWRSFCGGSWEGLATRLDYIQGMGFDAVWITPVVENAARGYHGYWATNFSRPEPRLGRGQALRALAAALHARGMWLMVVVVANHVAPVGEDYRQVHPFNRPEHYHAPCAVGPQPPCHAEDTLRCRLEGLPDLDQGHPWVRS